MLTPEAVVDAIDAQHAREPFSGVVRVATKDELLAHCAYGMADRANARPISVDTRLAIASGTKVFTATAVASLIDSGKVSFDTLLRDVVTVNLPHHDDSITLGHLLSHTAGNPDYFDEETMDDYGALWEKRPTYGMRTPTDFLAMFAQQPQKFSPGERFSYNNAGYILLGLAIEAASGQPYASYVREHVLERAGMSDSGFFTFDSLPRNCATGYLETHGHASNLFSVPAVGGPDGGMWTTAADMESFWTALRGGEIVSPAIVDLMLSPHSGPDEDGAYYGYGVWITEGTPATVYVEGEDPGVSMVSAVSGRSGAIVTILANTTTGAWPMQEAVMTSLAELG